MIRTFTAWLRGAAPTVVRDGAGLSGCAMIAVGVGMIFLPAGVIVAGVLLVGLAIVTARASA